MTITSIHIERPALPKQPDLRDPAVLQKLHAEAERQAERELLRRKLRRIRKRIGG